jgi:hypothetical protein
MRPKNRAIEYEPFLMALIAREHSKKKKLYWIKQNTPIL